MLFKRSLIQKKFNKKKKFKLKGFKKKDKFTLGTFSILAQQTTILSERQLESFYNTLSKTLKQFSSKTPIKIWFRVFPIKITTSKPKEMRMGGGKGKLNEKVIFIKAGNILCEFSNKTLTDKLKNPQKQLKGVLAKLAIKTKIYIK